MDAFIGEIRPFAFGFVPRGWLPCDGQLLNISQYTPLFAILGITYGGNGTSTFGLPNLAGITPVGSGTSPTTGVWPLGDKTGAETVTLLSSEIPSHNHTLVMELPGATVQNDTSATPTANSSWLSHPMQVTSPTAAINIPAFTPPASGNLDTNLHPSTIGIAGSSAPHENRQPYLAIQYCICNEGMFPPHP